MKAENEQKITKENYENKINRNRENMEKCRKEIQSLKLKMDDTKGKRIKNRKRVKINLARRIT